MCQQKHFASLGQFRLFFCEKHQGKKVVILHSDIFLTKVLWFYFVSRSAQLFLKIILKTRGEKALKITENISFQHIYKWLQQKLMKYVHYVAVVNVPCYWEAMN